jgi:ATP-binding cassette, subfamily B, bacterial
LAEFLRGRHDRLWGQRLEELRRVTDTQLRYAVFADLLGSLVIGGVLLLLVALAVSHEISLSSAAATVLLAQRLSLAGASTGARSESALYFEDYLALVSIGSPQSGEGLAVTSAGGVSVSVRDVSFAYTGASEPTLRGVSLEIAAGEVLALVGENGSGKTTLAKVLAGLYAPQVGSILWDGRDVGATGRDELRRRVAVIFQDFQRYALPVRENVGLGRPEGIDDEAALRRAAEMAGAAEMIARLPEGWETMLGPVFLGGVDLSMGQWQRVALARALFRDAPFVILDERRRHPSGVTGGPRPRRIGRRWRVCRSAPVARTTPPPRSLTARPLRSVSCGSGPDGHPAGSLTNPRSPGRLGRRVRAGPTGPC